jgi:pilus assembly protein CpaB
MKPARLIVLAAAVGAAGVAALIIMQQQPAPAPQVVTAAPVPSRSVDVLVAAADLPVGSALKAADLRWMAWPADLVPQAATTRAAAPNATEELKGSLVRQSFIAGEPIRKEKLVRADGAGFMSAVLPPGKRAIAISIDTRGATSAGGFILPNDRVDVLRIARDDDAARGGGDAQVAETILFNIRVLAIGQAVQEQNGQKVVTGDTATLELSPAQSETVALAQRTGQLTLVLRSLADAGQTAPEERPDTSLTIVRAGVGQTPRQKTSAAQPAPPPPVAR